MCSTKLWRKSQSWNQTEEPFSSSSQAIQVAQGRSAWLKLMKKSRLPSVASVIGAAGRMLGAGSVERIGAGVQLEAARGWGRPHPSPLPPAAGEGVAALALPVVAG